MEGNGEDWSEKKTLYLCPYKDMEYRCIQKDTHTKTEEDVLTAYICLYLFNFTPVAEYLLRKIKRKKENTGMGLKNNLVQFSHLTEEELEQQTHYAIA